MGVCGCATRPPSSTTGADSLESSSRGSGGVNCGIKRRLGWATAQPAKNAARRAPSALTDRQSGEAEGRGGRYRRTTRTPSTRESILKSEEMRI